MPPRQVRLDELVTTKDTLQLAALLDEDSTFYGDLFAHVVEWRGEYYLEDGLHRALRAALQQRNVLHARVHVVAELMQQAGRKSALTLSVLASLLVLVGAGAVNAATEPFPGKTDPPICVATSIDAGERVFPEQVRSASTTPATATGLAGRTIAAVHRGRVQPGRDRQRPGNARVRYGAQIWTTDPDKPGRAARRHPARSGAEVVRRERRRGRRHRRRRRRVRGARSRARRQWSADDDTEICSPPVS